MVRSTMNASNTSTLPPTVSTMQMPMQMQMHTVCHISNAIALSTDVTREPLTDSVSVPLTHKVSISPLHSTDSVLLPSSGYMDTLLLYSSYSVSLLHIVPLLASPADTAVTSFNRTTPLDVLLVPKNSSQSPWSSGASVPSRQRRSFCRRNFLYHRKKVGSIVCPFHTTRRSAAAKSLSNKVELMLIFPLKLKSNRGLQLNIRKRQLRRQITTTIPATQPIHDHKRRKKNRKRKY